jgi:hypothetical protein
VTEKSETTKADSETIHIIFNAHVTLKNTQKQDVVRTKSPLSLHTYFPHLTWFNEAYFNLT